MKDDAVTRHEQLIPLGTQVTSKGRFRHCRPVGPVWAELGSGADIVTDQGRFIDLVAGLGAITLGHRQNSRTPASYPLPTKHELFLAEHIQSIVPWAWRMRFLKNGGDATQAAIRLARVYTGRDKIVDFGNYHGCSDPFITEDHEGVPQCVRDLTLRLAKTEENLDRVDETVAAVILEMLPINGMPDGFLQKLRRRCSRVGTVLISDDVISGFRAHRRGAAGVTGVIPDLTCAGKAMANGWPISVVYGDADVMSCWERTHLSATHWADPACMQAAVETLHRMDAEDFWDKQAAWTFGGQPNNGHWAVTKLDAPEATFVQRKLLEKGVLSNLSQFYYLDLESHREAINEAFAYAFGELDAAKVRGDEIEKLLDCDVNKTLFRRVS